MRTQAFLSTTWISLSGDSWARKSTRPLRSDIIANCGEDTYNMLMAAVAAERQEQGEE
ncbi:MAG: hypothetical protein ACLTW9_00035 [Enterocloster sp.]